MSPDVKYPPAERPVNRNRRAVEEDNAWAALYRDIGQPSTAEEVVKYLDKDEAARQTHFALYLRAKDTMRRSKEAKERQKRVGNFVRLVVFYCLVTPVVAFYKGMKWAFTEGRDIAVEAMPATAASPAIARINELKKDPAIAPAIDGLNSQPGTSRRTHAA